MKYHAQDMTAATTPSEQCRRDLHIAVIIHAVLCIFYFLMVLVLVGDQLWVSTILLAGLNQFTINVGGLLTMRMWIYT